MSKQGLEAGQAWTEIASITAAGKEVATMKNTTFPGQAMGNLKDGGQAWLSVQVNEPSMTALGQYRCEGFGVDTSGHIQTLVTETDVKQEVLDLSKIREKIRHLKRAIFCR